MITGMRKGDNRTTALRGLYYFVLFTGRYA